MLQLFLWSPHMVINLQTFMYMQVSVFSRQRAEKAEVLFNVYLMCILFNSVVHVLQFTEEV